jgi:hypothetical protein
MRLRLRSGIMRGVTDDNAEVWVGLPGDGLLLRPEDRERDGSVVTLNAHLLTEGLSAQRVVDRHYASGFADLLEFFEGLAKDWRGWRGERSYSSLEYDLRLIATHDGGHIDLQVTVDVGDGWTASGHVTLEPGEQLTQVVRSLRLILEPRA